MEIREVRAFTAVAEQGSLSGAARGLHVSQSALSQTILSLERQLGVRLLVREGGALLPQHDRAPAAVTNQAAASVGPLRVGVPLELPADLLPVALAELRETFPQARPEISHASSAAQLAALRTGELDVALVRECPAGPDYDAVLAVEEAMGVFLAGSRASELAGPAGVRLHQLAQLDCVAVPRVG